MAKLGKPVVAFGCDSLKVGETDIKNYVGSAVYEPRKANRNFHDLKQERQLIDAMSEEYGVSIDFI
jgi:hypothetical protein